MQRLAYRQDQHDCEEDNGQRRRITGVGIFETLKIKIEQQGFRTEAALGQHGDRLEYLEGRDGGGDHHEHGRRPKHWPCHRQEPVYGVLCTV